MSATTSGPKTSSSYALSFVVITAAVFMANLDLWVANVALPIIGTAFHESSLARQA